MEMYIITLITGVIFAVGLLSIIASLLRLLSGAKKENERLIKNLERMERDSNTKSKR
jgi:hypothetical protein